MPKTTILQKQTGEFVEKAVDQQKTLTYRRICDDKPAPLPSNVTIDGNYVVISTRACRRHHPEGYSVPLVPIQDERSLLCWVRHLSLKTWITPELITEFIDVVAQKQKLDVFE